MISQEAEQRERDTEKKRQLEYKKDLQDQMILNYQLQQNKYEEFLQEKKYLDSVLERIYDEDQRFIKNLVAGGIKRSLFSGRRR